jgi:HSP20 family protein
MSLTRYARMPSMFRDFDELFRDFAAPMVDTERTTAVLPAADVVETEKRVELRLDMPGVDPEQIEVKLDGNLLTVSAERKNERTEQSKGWIRQERAWGTFTRSFTLPNTLDGSKPEATYRHGVLTVSLPKKEEVLPRTLKVKVEA